MRKIKADIAVVGAGSAGLSVASGAAQLGLRVVLFEKGEMGGDCLNYGCVPSKALIAAADAAHQAHIAARLGVDAEPRIDFTRVMAHVHASIAAIAPHDSQARFEGLGVTVVREAARFTGPRTLQSASVEVTARKIAVATGSRARAPSIAGLPGSGFLTNETVWGLTELPRRLVVLGAGPIGLELGQAFRRLGSQVAIVEAREPLPFEDRALVEPLLAQLASEGIEVFTGRMVEAVERTDQGIAVVSGGHRIEGSHLLLAVGREPVLDGLNLDAADVAHGPRGVTLDRQLRSTTNRNVFFLGDAAGREAFTHVAGAHASLFVRKALFAQPVDADALVTPRVTYTDPEIAAVGLSEREAREVHGDGVRAFTVPFSGNDRAIAEGDTRGLGKLVLDARGRILGVGIVGKGAGELIHPWVLAMTAKLKLRAFTDFIAPYPTRGEIHKRLASAHFSPILFSDRTRALVNLLKRF